jgi:hypothetical protein
VRSAHHSPWQCQPTLLLVEKEASLMTSQQVPPSPLLLPSPPTDSVKGEAPVVSTDCFEYLSVEEIKPCERPQRELSRVVSDLIQHDWPEIFSTLNVVRQLAIHHKQALIQSGQLHALVLGVNKQVL